MMKRMEGSDEFKRSNYVSACKWILFVNTIVSLLFSYIWMRIFIFNTEIVSLGAVYIMIFSIVQGVSVLSMLIVYFLNYEVLGIWSDQ